MRLYILLALIILPRILFGQDDYYILHRTIDEIVITPVWDTVGDVSALRSPLWSLEEMLTNKPDLNLVQRGGYAPEIIYRGLNPNQVNTSIDGMRIYGACTDRMDPVNSYVSRRNLRSFNVDRELKLNAHSLDLSFQDGVFVEKKALGGFVESAFSDNALERSFSTGLNWDDKNFWIRSNFSMNSADNYFDGTGREIRFTQYNKFNGFLRSQVKLNEINTIGATVIIDHAWDVGYAALPMDVATATALIFKLEHEVAFEKVTLRNQVYYNNIVHIMDDTKRDSVAMHMDMPGWSSTLGISGNYSIWRPKTQLGLKYELVSNKRRADMTMYLPGFNDMYMQTWPEVRRTFTSLAPFFNHQVSKKVNVYSQLNLIFNQDEFLAEFGIKQMEVLAYDASEPLNNISYNADVSANYHYKRVQNEIKFSHGIRLPELSERYGFYLFNSQDGFDYLGNPRLQQERYTMIDNRFKFSTRTFNLVWSNYGYYFTDYIFARVDDSAWPMTIGANGIKTFNNEEQAFILGSDAKLTIFSDKAYPTAITVNYRYGELIGLGYLPFMSPVEYGITQNFFYKKFDFQARLRYVHAYRRNAIIAGEQKVDAYWLSDIAAHRTFGKKEMFQLSIGIENLFDALYTTHFNWNRLPQMGRRSWISIVYNF